MYTRISSVRRGVFEAYSCWLINVFNRCRPYGAARFLGLAAIEIRLLRSRGPVPWPWKGRAPGFRPSRSRKRGSAPGVRTKRLILTDRLSILSYS